eukprot:CAMPEP_0119413280 /NCGR_PEP_ID=MMETSP1335-20130426/5419_1 /TAXON_ID=259385 /ORGANISM="Chrysoculter rhomboideus, Strain RCC1486" /LENGTH=509 /DNA_ID=CAMNT_0007438063 /DNA_START=59 /DNA_END=1586 /DNA_ORIENTATION=+
MTVAFVLARTASGGARGSLRPFSPSIRASMAAVVASSGRAMAGASRPLSTWTDVPMGPPDPILGLTQAFNEDTNPKKVSLGVGAYRDSSGKPAVLQCVRTAEEQIVAAKMNKEYLGITGLPDFITRAVDLMLGPNTLADGNIAAVQTLSGTGGCRLVGDFYARFLGTGTPIYLPDPTWANHKNIFRDAGLDIRAYRYWKPDTRGLDLDGMLEDIASAPDGSVILLHACAHNPTGVDPTHEQWAQISDLCAKKNLYIFFDSAYQGFASGDPEYDAHAVRLFRERGHRMALCQSFAKNFGLYGERVGVLSMVCADRDEAKRVESQLKMLIRPMYSNPPVHGARIVSRILGDEGLSSQWRTECKGMADRIISMRKALRSELERLGSKRPWNHVTDQIGMFCYSGMTEEQVLRLRSEYAIYITNDGRISMAGVTDANVGYIAAAIHEAQSEHWRRYCMLGAPLLCAGARATGCVWLPDRETELPKTSASDDHVLTQCQCQCGTTGRIATRVTI